MLLIGTLPKLVIKSDLIVEQCAVDVDFLLLSYRDALRKEEWKDDYRKQESHQGAKVACIVGVATVYFHSVALAELVCRLDAACASIFAITEDGLLFHTSSLTYAIVASQTV